MTKPTTPDSDNELAKLVVTSKWGSFFGIAQETFDAVWTQLTAPEGNSVTYISMEIGADRDVFHPVKDHLQRLGIVESTDPQLDFYVQKYLHGPEKIPNYGGGLGILAGDTLKSYADNNIPVVAISLLYRKGYFSQLVDSRLGQIAWAKEWHPEETPTLFPLHAPDQPDQPLEIEVPFYDRRDTKTVARARVWMKIEANADLDGFVPHILLDYCLDSTPEWIRNAAQNLYDASSERSKAIQRRLLGSSVTTVMDTLGITSKTIHLNEQHGVVLVLHLIAATLEKRLGPEYTLRAEDSDILDAAAEVSKRVVYTIHTPVKAGHDRFEKNLYAELGHSFCQRVLHLLAADEDWPEFFNFTALAMKVNRATNAVSRLHKDVTQRQFPQFADKISAITNGVHHLTWISDAKAACYDSFKEFANWRHDPSVFRNAADLIKDKTFRHSFSKAWQQDTTVLIQYVNRMLIQHRNAMLETWIDPPNYLSHREEKEAALSPEVYTIGFARRFSTYKRADLIFEDIDALAAIIVDNNYPVNFVFAGKAHPADEPGKTLIKQILNTQEELFTKTNGLGKLIFIPGYDMAIAKMMVSGVHAWLNCPKRPLEASGTSGMKAALNGVPNISIMDGWWVEGYHDGKTGWKFGYEAPVRESSFSEDPNALLYEEDSASFYAMFPEVLAAFYGSSGHEAYLDRSIMNLALNNPVFNTHRMAAEYVARYALNLPRKIQKKIAAFGELYQSDL